MITCLIVDDEPFALHLLEDHIRQTGFLTLAHRCNHALDALAWLRHNRADVIFLDIEMPKLSGMELSSLLPPEQKIVFTTAYPQYAVESYEKNAVDYLLKPITFERFLKTALKINALFGKADSVPAPIPAAAPVPEADFMFAKTGRAIVKILFDEITFVEGLKDYVAIHTATPERHVVYKRMKEMEELLPAHFRRVHLSYIVNLRKIRAIEDQQIFIGQKTVPVSEKYKDEFMAAIREHLI